jgi:hypothetical protein
VQALAVDPIRSGMVDAGTWGVQALAFSADGRRLYAAVPGTGDIVRALPR